MLQQFRSGSRQVCGGAFLGLLLCVVAGAAPARADVLTYDYSATFSGGTGDLTSGTISGVVSYDITTQLTYFSAQNSYYENNVPFTLLANGSAISLSYSQYQNNGLFNATGLSAGNGNDNVDFIFALPSGDPSYAAALNTYVTGNLDIADNGGQCGSFTQCTMSSVQFTAVPEPRSALLLAAGALAMCAALGAPRWRRGVRRACSP